MTVCGNPFASSRKAAERIVPPEPLSLRMMPTVVAWEGSDAALTERIPLPFHAPLARPLRMAFIRAFQSLILLAAVLSRMTSPSPTSRVVAAPIFRALVRSSLLPPGKRLNREVSLKDSDLRCWLEVALIRLVPVETTFSVGWPAPSLLPVKASEDIE